jgi:dihydroorotate dehydrogenase electron transfer subunit
MPGMSTTTPNTPESAHSSQRGQFVAVVVENVPLCREHFRLVLRVPRFPETRPGQFVQVLCRDIEHSTPSAREVRWEPGRPLEGLSPELMNPLPFLRRPFSLAGRRQSAEGVELDLIHRAIGRGTRWLGQLRPGQRVSLLGPLGTRFTLPAPEAPAILIGGGVGIPPMLYLAEQLAGRSAVAFCGALTRELLPLTIMESMPAPGPTSVRPLANVAEFARHRICALLSTDDGSYGFRGFVTQALEGYLEESGFRVQGSDTPQRVGPKPVIYTCGPEPMMRRVAEIAAERGLPCQVAAERAMACGMGTCQSCCIRVRKEDPARPPLAGKDWAWRLTCTDGPVFRGEALLW